MGEVQQSRAEHHIAKAPVAAEEIKKTRSLNRAGAGSGGVFTTQLKSERRNEDNLRRKGEYCRDGQCRRGEFFQQKTNRRCAQRIKERACAARRAEVDAIAAASKLRAELSGQTAARIDARDIKAVSYRHQGRRAAHEDEYALKHQRGEQQPNQRAEKPRASPLVSEGGEQRREYDADDVPQRQRCADGGVGVAAKLHIYRRERHACAECQPVDALQCGVLDIERERFAFCVHTKPPLTARCGAK